MAGRGMVMCRVDGCEKPVRRIACGLCSAHETRQRLYGDVNALHRTNGEVHTEKSGINCSVCGLNVLNPAQLRKHIRAFHPDTLVFLCPYCEERFCTVKGLQLHLGRKHPVEFAQRDMSPVWRQKNLMRYGITPEQYEAMVHEQGGVCAICGGGPTGRHNRLYVDHDHESGMVRGLLCQSCNFMIGLAGDNRDILNRAIEYLGATS